MQTFITEMWFLLRVVVALLLGFIVGLERKARYKEAGIRTHALVCAGAALMMVVSKYGFSDGEIADRARIAAQIVTGIGFLGAGIIVYRKESLRGLTTAAGIWMTAGVGMAVGAGLFYLGVGAAILILLLHLFMSLPISLLKTKRFFHFKIKFKCENTETETVKELFNVQRYSKINYEKDSSGQLNVIAEIYTVDFFSDEAVRIIILKNPFIYHLERIVE